MTTENQDTENIDDWVAEADIPRLGGWQRIAAKMGIVSNPEKVEARRRQRLTEGILRQRRLDRDIIDPRVGDVIIERLEEVIEVRHTRNERNVTAPPQPRPTAPPAPPTDPRPPIRRVSGKGGVSLP